MVQINRKVFILILGVGLLAGAIVAVVAAKGAWTAPATEIASTSDSTTETAPWHLTHDPNRILVQTDESGTPWWKMDDGQGCCWRVGTGPTATPTPWVTWTPMPTSAYVDLVNSNPVAGVAEVENKTNEPIMFVDLTPAVHFDYFDPIKMKEYHEDLYPGREQGQWNISCVVYPGERGYFLGWPQTFEDTKSTAYHYQVFGVPRPDLEARRDYIHMPYQNLQWKVNGNELDFSFDMEKFDGYALYQVHGVYEIIGTLFLYDKNDALINILFHHLRLSDGGHIDGSTVKGPALWIWSMIDLIENNQIPVNQVDHVRLLIEREEQPDCIRFPEKTYVFTPTPKPTNTPTVTPNPTPTGT